MTHLPDLRFAVFTDLHIGSSTAQRWHNQFLSDDPARTLAGTVASVNRERADFVAVLGDLADHGAEPELCAAREGLDRLDAPWIACQGNHDVTPGGERAPFEAIFGDRAPVGILPPGQLPLPEGVAALTFTADWRDQDGGWRVYLPDAQIGAALARLDALRPDVLLIFCHFPFVRQSEHVRAHNGKNAGTLWNGEEQLRELAARTGRTLVFTGHQHFHHITQGDSWLHCTTASLVEYPAEYRIVTLGAGGVSIRTACGAPDIVAAAPAPEVTWVRGEPNDREL